jgi:16S rRNA G966 N2-methylase RsmD
MGDRNYPGAKTNSGILQFLINRIPLHRRYFELFAGSATLAIAKRRAEYNYISDIDPKVCDALLHKLPAHFLPCYCRPAIECFILNEEKYKAFRAAHPQWGTGHITPFKFQSDDFIYLDPPYPFSSRRYQGKIYRHEMTDEDHAALLKAVKRTAAMVMISTRQNDLYSTALKGWRKETFTVRGRRSTEEEIVYMNYPAPALLHQYDFLGEGYIDRQRIKRKVERFNGKIEELPPYEKHLFIQMLIENDAPAVQHFLSMQYNKR